MLIYKRQTDPELRMLDMIYYRDSTFHIVINEEESEELDISGDIYRKYKTLVTTLIINKQTIVATFISVVAS